jgi:hypothetical protein
METKPEKKTKTTTIIVTADLLRQLHTPSSSSKEGLRNKQAKETKTTPSTHKQPAAAAAKTKRAEKKNQKNREKRGKSQVDFRCEKSLSATKKAPKKITEMGRKTEHLPP